VAATVARLEAVLSADTARFDRAMDRSDKHFSKFGHAVKTGALAAGAAIGVGLALSAKAGWDEFKQGALVGAQTEAVLKSTGKSANVTAKQVDDLATSLMKKSGIDDEVIKSGENMLLTFTSIRNEAGKGNDIFNQSTKILTDMSVALGTDMKKSAIQLGKALNDPIKGVTALRRVGVQFDEGQIKTIKHLVETGHKMDAQKLILRELNKEFGGSAEAAGKTLPGQLNILKETFNNVVGEIVGKMVPGLVKFATWAAPLVLKAMDAISKSVSAVVGFFRSHWGEIMSVAMPVLKGLQTGAESVVGFFRAHWPEISATISKAFEIIQTTAQKVWPKVLEAGRAVVTWYKANLAPTITAVIGYIRTFWNRWGEDIIAITKRVFGVLSSIIRPMLVGLRATIELILALIRGDWGKAWDALKTIVASSLHATVAIIRGLGGLILQAAVFLGKQILLGIANGLKGILGRIEDLGRLIHTGIRRVAGAVFAWAMEIGMRILDGIVAGVKSAPGKIKDAVFGVAKSGLSGAAGLLGIHSPSELSAKMIGRPLSDGIVKGILSGKIPVTEALVEVARNAVDKAKTRVQALGGELATWITQAFNAKQSAKRTPTEILISKKELERQKKDLADAINSAKADLAAAQASGDPAAVAAAQKALDDAEYNQWLFDAQRKADAERKALDNAQWIEQQHFQKRLAALQAYLESGHATAKGSTKRINDLLHDFGLTNASMGDLLGKMFVLQLRAMIPLVVKAAVALRKATEAEGVILEGRTITIKIEDTKSKKGKGDPAGAAPSGLIPIGKWLQSMGYQVGEHPAFGGVTPGAHVAGSYHYRGRAIDVNWPGGGGVEYSHLKKVFPALNAKPHVELMIEDILKSNQHLHFAMAKGGFGTVSRPTMFLAGEAGKEDFGFVPHSRGRLGGGDIVLNINGPIYGSKEHMMALMREAAAQFARRNNRTAFGT
jgi:hypothetical protein